VIIGHLIPAGTGSPHYQDTQAILSEEAMQDFSDDLEVGPAASVEPADGLG